MKGMTKLALAIALVVALGWSLAGGIGPLASAQVTNQGAETGAQQADAQAAAPTTAAVPPLPLAGNPYAIADVVESIVPSVVYIEVEWPAPPQQRRSPFNDPFFRDFFRPFYPWPDSQPRTSRGTGFIIDDEGHILTNQHVVGDAGEGQTITVKISAGSYQGEVEAKIIGSDYKLDLAVLQIEKPEGLDAFPVARLGDSDASRPGEWVVAVGNPYGEQYEHTVTVGVLSAKGRKIQIYDSDARQWREYSNLMQTDAAINPGNSGGPLVNLKGEVIGINTAVNAAAQGIGFAIPINTALEVRDELITEGRVVRVAESKAFLGVSYDGLTEELANWLGLGSTDGVIIVDVLRNTAAEKAGLRVYDVVLRVGDQEITGMESFVEAITSYKPGDDVLLMIYRQGRRIVVPVTLGDAADYQS